MRSLPPPGGSTYSSSSGAPPARTMSSCLILSTLNFVAARSIRPSTSSTSNSVEVENLIECAQATIVSAAARKECRGAHTVSDYERPADDPKAPLGRDDVNWLKHSLWYNLLAACAASLSFAGQVVYAVPLANRIEGWLAPGAES